MLDGRGIKLVSCTGRRECGLLSATTLNSAHVDLSMRLDRSFSL